MVIAVRDGGSPAVCFRMVFSSSVRCTSASALAWSYAAVSAGLVSCGLLARLAIEAVRQRPGSRFDSGSGRYR
jgi:hypothetical protein